MNPVKAAQAVATGHVSINDQASQHSICTRGLTASDVVGEAFQYADDNITDVECLPKAMIHRGSPLGEDANTGCPEREPRKLVLYQ